MRQSICRSTSKAKRARLICKPKKFEKCAADVISETFLEEGETMETGTATTLDKLVEETVCANGFLSTVHKAFAEEQQIAFSPSQIWTAIMQQVSIHVNENAEELRSLFVDHEGRKVLKVRMDHLDIAGNNSADAWSLAFPKFVGKLEESVKDAALLHTMNKPYESSNSVDQIGFTIAMMDSLKKFFEYRCHTLCGIKAVHLLDTTAEWVELRARADLLLQKLSMQWWAVELLPVLDEFVRLASGDSSNTVFWEHMYRDLSPSGSGAEYSGFGWINVFFPYKGKEGGGFRRRCCNYRTGELLKQNKTIEQMKQNLSDTNFFADRHGDWFANSMIAFADYPAGANKCPFKWVLEAISVMHDMRFCAGFLECVGVVEHNGVDVYTPAQGWAVVYHEKNISYDE